MIRKAHDNRDIVTEYIGDKYTELNSSARRYLGRAGVRDDHLEDITQNAFHKSLRGAHNFSGINEGIVHEYQFKGWFYRILHNEYVSHVRKEVKQRSTFIQSKGEELSHVDKLLLQIDIQILMDSLATLKPDQMEVVNLRYLVGLNCIEIGDQLGYSPGKVRSSLFRARKNIRKAMIKNPQYTM